MTRYFKWLAAIAAGAAVSNSPPLLAATLFATPGTLEGVFAAANAGDTIALAGTFSSATRLQNRTFASNVTLDATRAVFTDTLVFSNVSNVTVKSGTFYILGGSSYNRGAVVYDSSHVTFDRATVAGVGNEIGISFQNSTNATVLHSRFDGLRAAIGFDTVTGGLINGNHITHAVSDGIDIGNSHGITASSNICTLGTPGPWVHPDCIQLWSTVGQPVQSDNVVTRNTAIGPTQGFTSFPYGGGGLRLTITHNNMTSSYPQGIACYDCIDSNISFNTVSTLPGSAHITNINIIGGTGNTVISNVIHAYTPPAVNSALPSPDSAFGFSALDDLPVSSDTIGVIPEPSTWAMLVAGFAGVGVARRRSVRRGGGDAAGRPA
jgi:hypothetical protein